MLAASGKHNKDLVAIFCVLKFVISIDWLLLLLVEITTSGSDNLVLTLREPTVIWTPHIAKRCASLSLWFGCHLTVATAQNKQTYNGDEKAHGA